MYVVNVNVHVYRPDIPVTSVDCTIYTFGIGTHTHLLWGEFSICTLFWSYSQSLQLHFLIPSGTHYCWVGRGSIE